jgi:hypothetical protein
MIEYVVIRNKNRQQIGIIDFFSTIIWTRKFAGVGDFFLKAPATPEHIEFLKRGNYITRNDDKEVGIIENVTVTNNLSEGKMITATGRFAKSILDRRLIYRFVYKQNQPTTISGNVETAVRSLIKNNIIEAVQAERNINFIELGDLAGHSQIIVDDTGKAATKQTSYANLLTYTDDILYEYDLSSLMTMGEDKKLYYSIFAGQNRAKGSGNNPVIFSYEFDNIKNAVFSENGTGEKTMALIGGSGQDLNRFYAVYNDNMSGIDRKEVFVEASSISKEYNDANEQKQTYTDDEYRTLLLSYAKQQIAPMAVVFTFDGEIDVNNNVYEYKKDFDLGDTVTFSDNGIELPVKIVTITEAQDSGGYKVSVELSA